MITNPVLIEAAETLGAAEARLHNELDRLTQERPYPAALIAHIRHSIDAIEKARDVVNFAEEMA